MDFDATITFSPSGADPVLGEALLESFLAAAPACDPVVDQDTKVGSATVHFSVVADDAAQATRFTAAIVTAVAARLAKAGATQPTAVHVDPLDRRTLQPA
jgi:hypothetical protein